MEGKKFKPVKEITIEKVTIHANPIADEEEIDGTA